MIKQGDDYTFQQQATVYNNVPKDFNEINDFKAFSRKIKGYYKDKSLARLLSLSWVLSLIFVFVSNYAIAVYCCNLLFPRFNFDSVLYLSLRPIILLNFFSNGQLMYILYLLVSHVYLSQFQSINIRMPIILCYQYLNFSKYSRNPYIHHVYFVCNFNCLYPFTYIF